jgi:hypothetical protein
VLFWSVQVHQTQNQPIALDYRNQISSAFLNDKLIRGEMGIGCSCNLLQSISNCLASLERNNKREPTAGLEDALRFLSCNWVSCWSRTECNSICTKTPTEDAERYQV